MGKICPKHVDLILEINKLLLLHLVGFLYYFTYIDDARSNTNKDHDFIWNDIDAFPWTGQFSVHDPNSNMGPPGYAARMLNAT